MKYVKVFWNHSLPDEPVVLFSEIDDNGWEKRKVYVFRTGLPGVASSDQSTRSVFLSTELFPSLAQIAADPQFIPFEISPKEFEETWNEAVKR